MSIGEIASKIRNIFQPAEFVKRNEDGTIQIKTAYNRTIDDIEEAFPYGLKSMARKGNVTVLCAGGSLDAVRVLPVESTEGAPELEEGDVALWNEDGSYVLLKANGVIEITNGGDKPSLDDGDAAIYTSGGSLIVCCADGTVELNGTQNGRIIIADKLRDQLSKLTARVDALYDALKNSPTTAEDGGAAYKAAIVQSLASITEKEDFSDIESDKVSHGTGAD